MTAFVDHLIVFCPELEAGRDWAEARLGARPAVGGRHPDLGTHNALLGLGPSSYLEIMAPDPAAERPADLAALVGGTLEQPRLATWVLRAEDIEDVHARAAAPAGLGAIQEGQRDNPDGTRVRWRITSPFLFPCDGVVPFLIAWGDTPHPGTRLPEAGRLVELAVAHPAPARVHTAFDALGIDVPIAVGAPRIVAVVETPSGPVRLP